MALTLTEKAADHVQKFLTKRGKGIGIRVGVKTSGCSGMAYALEFADEVEPEDNVFESNGVKVVVDPKSLVYIDGTQIDFVKEGLNSGFKFQNPNEKESCGCGKSFHVETRTEKFRTAKWLLLILLTCLACPMPLP